MDSMVPSFYAFRGPVIAEVVVEINQGAAAEVDVVLQVASLYRLTETIPVRSNLVPFFGDIRAVNLPA